MGKRKSTTFDKSKATAANLGFEAKLWLTADKRRNNMVAAKYKHVVRVLVEMLAPDKGRVYDPCGGSTGMFAQSEKFVEEHGGRIGDIAVYGQASNSTTRRLAMMNLAIRGIEGDLGPEHPDTFRRDLHNDLKADYVLANPPFNDSDWKPTLRGPLHCSIRSNRRSANRKGILLECDASRVHNRCQFHCDVFFFCFFTSA